MLNKTSLSTGELMELFDNETSLSDGGGPMPSWCYNLVVVVLTFNQFFGSILNAIVIVFMCSDSQIWNASNIIILINLICSDFAVSVLGNPFALASAYNHRWEFGETGCQYYGFLMGLFGINAITTMSVLAFNRYLLVCRPFSPYQLKNRGAMIVVASIWLYSSAVTSPPLFGWAAFVPEAANISCSVNWEEKSAMSYIVYIFIFGLVLPMILICFSYANIIITMKKSAARVNKTSSSEKRVSIMVLLMIAAFILAWSPYATFALIKQFGDVDWITPGIAVIPSIFAKTSIVYNPIIYVFMNGQFRAAFELRIRGIKKTQRIMTVSTNAGINDDDDVRQTIRERLQVVNRVQQLEQEEHIELQPVHVTVKIKIEHCEEEIT